ncbi:DNA methyltransferase [Phyllobacterium sp. SB3]|uniref:class I SAM-dependent DNA methyltransferase n=1 Tax=Phyllobacterium sp. SB3 TaxID=3156073 RepID=UPI0032AEDEA5
MHADDFITKWRASTLKERSASQSHFNDLCDLLGVEQPISADPTGEWYCFERGASKAAGGEGWADVWRRGAFGWEYKGKRKDLRAAYSQLLQYSVALENPPLLIVSDMDRIIIHTNWTNTVSETHEILMEDLRDYNKREFLRNAFVEPERLKPKKTIDALTMEAADKFASLAIRLRERGHQAHKVAHFINRLVFCMFAEDISLLPRKLFTQILDRAFERPSIGSDLLTSLFEKMKSGGLFGIDQIAWFNGGLFDDANVVDLNKEDIELVRRAAELDWSDIDPSIFGTLFERGLDPAKRAQLGAHYTDREKIMMIVRPTIIEPLLSKWETVFTEIKELCSARDKATLDIKAVLDEASALYKLDADKAKKSDKGRQVRITKLRKAATEKFNRAHTLRDKFLQELREFRVLDPACGSGNFLYMALHVLKDLDHRVRLDCESFGIERGVPEVSPAAVLGIELNPYAAELARVSVWIGEIQWMRKNGFEVNRDPILKTLSTIENRDALLNEDGSASQWPRANVIIGNPPFLGSRKLQPELGREYVRELRAVYGGSVPDGADLVTFWIHKAGEALKDFTDRVGLVTTNSIADGKNREVLAKAASKGKIFEAWSDEPWTVDGASVRVSMVCLASSRVTSEIRLDGKNVDTIFADLTAKIGETGVDLTRAGKLLANKGIAFQGVVPRGSLNRADAMRLGLPPATYLVDAEQATGLLSATGNPNGRPNSDVVVPYLIGDEIVNRPYGRSIVDFNNLNEYEASLYEAPFKYIKPVREHRAHMNQKEALETWWRHWNTRPAMRKALVGKRRFIATPRVSKHRIFRWVSTSMLADNMVVAIARDDDLAFGILQSRLHDLWSLRMCSYLGMGNDPRYTPSTTFETFPFPDGLTPDIELGIAMTDPRAKAIANAAQELNRTRERWLNPQELVGVEIDPDQGMSVVHDAIDTVATSEVKRRTLTKLYNEKPSWLITLHERLDAAVAAAYGWPSNVSDDDIIAKLFALNLSRGKDRQ